MQHKQHGSVHVIIVTSATLLVFGIVGYMFWNNFMSPKDSPSNSASIQDCVKKIKDQYIAKHGSKWATEIDTSACSSNVTPTADLTQAQKDENKRNSEIISVAAKTHDANKCDEIKGIYFTGYPANLTKVIIRTEDEAKKECQSMVAGKIESDEKTTERLSHYFELNGWGIKLYWDDNSDKVLYYAVGHDSNGSPRSYEFTTKNTAIQNEGTSNSDCRLGTIARESDPKSVGKGTYLQTKIGNFYYWDIPPKKPCPANSASIQIRSMIIGAQSQSTS